MIFWIGYTFKYFPAYFEIVIAVSQKCSVTKITINIGFEE
jgi:hypothetical protein